MITNFKNYNLNELHIGDFVLLNIKSLHINTAGSEREEQIFIDFVNNNIGEVVDLDIFQYNIKVKYNNIPFFIKHIFEDDKTYWFNMFRISEFDKTVKELKLKLDTKKYNL